MTLTGDYLVRVYFTSDRFKFNEKKDKYDGPFFPPLGRWQSDPIVPSSLNQ